MKRVEAITERERQILDLLSQGRSAQDVAAELGYSFGTVRVFLHHLYKKLGVRDKHSAVVWYHENQAGKTQRQQHAMSSFPPPNETFGDLAIRVGLDRALGIYSTLLGPFGRVWEAAARMKGSSELGASKEIRGLARFVWEALVADAIEVAVADTTLVAIDKHSTAAAAFGLPLLLLLELHGELAIADRVATSLGAKSRGTAKIQASEIAVAKAVRKVVASRRSDALLELQAQIARVSLPIPTRHSALVALFYIYRGRGDGACAKDVADLLFSEAERTRVHLAEMGIRIHEPRIDLPDVPSRTKSGQRRAAVRL